MKKQVFVRETLNYTYFVMEAESISEATCLADKIDDYPGINAKEVKFDKVLEQAMIICTTYGYFNVDEMLEKLDLFRAIEPSKTL